MDKTGFAGGYDFSLKFANGAAELKNALEDVVRGTGQSVASAVLERLGLNLEPEKAPLPVLVVVHGGPTWASAADVGVRPTVVT